MRRHPHRLARARRTSRATVRSTPPFEVMAYSSSSGCTISAPTSAPRVETIRAVKTPLPPLPCTGYSSSWFSSRTRHSVAISRSVSPGATTSMASSSSASSKRIPITPDGGTAHRSQLLVVGVEPDRLGLPADQHQVVIGGDQPGGDQLVVIPQIDRDYATGAAGVVLLQSGLLAPVPLGRDHQVRRGIVIGNVDDLGDPLVWLKGQDVRYVLAAWRRACSGSSCAFAR